jgi:enoyl-CoA hydratase
MSGQPGTTVQLDERGVAVLTIDNTARLNALSTHLMETLIAAVEALEPQPGLRAVVLRGAGERAFIGGADINEMATLDAQSARGFITLVHRSCDAIRRLPVPVIARLQGYAFGAGVEVAAACDIRIAAIGSQFGMPEVRLGIPSVVEAALLPQLIGWGRTRRLLLTGDTIDAATALAWGLVEEVAPIELLDQAIDRILDSILASGPQAIRLQKALIDAWEGLPPREAIQRGIGSFAAAWQTDEPARMMQAYFASRSARRGR